MSPLLGGSGTDRRSPWAPGKRFAVEQPEYLGAMTVEVKPEELQPLPRIEWPERKCGKIT
jgi:hypothetical protein